MCKSWYEETLLQWVDECYSLHSGESDVSEEDVDFGDNVELNWSNQSESDSESSDYSAENNNANNRTCTNATYVAPSGVLSKKKESSPPMSHEYQMEHSEYSYLQVEFNYIHAEFFILMLMVTYQSLIEIHC